jgi:general secretion pathway protein F/type IV pilus assembly protein PilC
MIYKFNGFDKNGIKRIGKIEADTIELARNKLKIDGFLIDEIMVINDNQNILSFLNRQSKIKYVDLANLSRELSMYMKSGITIVNAIKIVKTHYVQNKKMFMFLESIISSLDEGQKLYTSLHKQRVYILPEFFLQSIKVSEDNGVIADVLNELSSFLKEHDRITKEVRASFAYPAFMIFVSLAMVSSMLTFVVPKITNMFISMKQELPLVTRIVVNTANFINNHIFFIVIGIIIIVVSLIMAIKKSYKFAKKLDTHVFKIPLIGKIILKNELARFSYITALLINSGVPIVHAINLSSKVFSNKYLKDIFSDASQYVVEGSKLSNSLKRLNFNLDESFIQAVSIGEETSQLSNVFLNISNLYFEENKDSIKIVLSLLEPLLMLFVGGVIGFIVIAMLLPIFSMSI